MKFCLADGGDGDTYPDSAVGRVLVHHQPDGDLFETGANAGKLQLTESYFGAGDPRLTR